MLGSSYDLCRKLGKGIRDHLYPRNNFILYWLLAPDHTCYDNHQGFLLCRLVPSKISSNLVKWLYWFQAWSPFTSTNHGNYCPAQKVISSFWDLFILDQPRPKNFQRQKLQSSLSSQWYMLSWRQISAFFSRLRNIYVHILSQMLEE